MKQSMKKSTYKTFKSLIQNFESSEKLVDELMSIDNGVKKLISSKKFKYNTQQISLKLPDVSLDMFLCSDNYYFEANSALEINGEKYYIIVAPKTDDFYIKEGTSVLFNLVIEQENKQYDFIQAYIVRKEDKNKPAFVMNSHNDNKDIIMIV